MFENIDSDVIGMKLPNGQVKVVKSKVANVSEGTIVNNESEFYAKYQVLNEGTQKTNKCTLLDSING